VGGEEEGPMSSTATQFLRNKNGKQINVRIGGKAKPKLAGKRPVPFATIRCQELDAYFTDRYGMVLPDDDAGREDVQIMLNHIAHRHAQDRQWLMHDWLDRRAPWLIGEERAACIAKAFRNPIRYTADTLAEKLGLTFARRQRLGIHSIGAIDMPKEAREEMRKAKKRDAKRKARLAAGCLSRDEYEANSISRQKPWLKDGISSRTWYRRQQQQETLYAGSGLVPRIVRARMTVTILR
jgi:hypothetical protein